MAEEKPKKNGASPKKIRVLDNFSVAPQPRCQNKWGNQSNHEENQPTPEISFRVTAGEHSRLEFLVGHFFSSLSKAESVLPSFQLSTLYYTPIRLICQGVISCIQPVTAPLITSNGVDQFNLFLGLVFKAYSTF